MTFTNSQIRRFTSPQQRSLLRHAPAAGALQVLNHLYGLRSAGTPNQAQRRASPNRFSSSSGTVSLSSGRFLLGWGASSCSTHQSISRLVRSLLLRTISSPLPLATLPHPDDFRTRWTVLESLQPLPQHNPARATEFAGLKQIDGCQITSPLPNDALRPGGGFCPHPYAAPRHQRLASY
jgi:hypothetical protein